MKGILGWVLICVIYLTGPTFDVTARVTRDVTGHYHGEHHHHAPEVNQSVVFPPNCLCVVARTGCVGREEYTKKFQGASTLTCGHAYELCCFEDPWPGVVDNFAGVAPCIPQEECTRYYGQQPTDIRDYGVLGPCPGAGTVRCLHPGVPPPPPPNTIVIPIVTAPETPPSVHYEVPVPATEPPTVPTTLPPTEVPPPPPTEAPPPPPATSLPPIYDLPPPPSPPLIYTPPQNPPVVVPTPPQPSYEAPEPVKPPAPPLTTYEAPKPVQVYEPPKTSYGAPEPVTLNEPAPAPVYSRAGPPYLWQRINSPYPYSNRYGWPGYGFRVSSRLGLGYGLLG